jgi:hypothetical protein
MESIKKVKTKKKDKKDKIGKKNDEEEKDDEEEKQEKQEKKEDSLGDNDIVKYFYKMIKHILSFLQNLKDVNIVNFVNGINFEDPLIQTIKINYIFYITTLICLAVICYYSGGNFIWSIVTFIVVSFLGYITHYISHSVNVTKFYDSLNNDNYFTNNKIVHYFIKLMCKCADFHDEIHHNTSINKKVHNVIFEFIFNFYTQAGAFLAIMYFVKKLNYYSVILWGLIYPTIHLINYDIIKCQVHMKHHLDKHTNYGIDIWDIMFNTKYQGDNTDIENINHYSINVIVISAILVYVINNKYFNIITEIV